MATHRMILDTDILSAVLRMNPLVLHRSRAYVAEHGPLTFSIISQYEVLRGLKVKKAVRQQAAFQEFCIRSSVLPLTEEIVARAADVYAELRERGDLIGDADILIAASALVHGYGLVTNNEDHFKRIRDLRVENWLK